MTCESIAEMSCPAFSRLERCLRVSSYKREGEEQHHVSRRGPVKASLDQTACVLNNQEYLCASEARRERVDSHRGPKIFSCQEMIISSS
jgi:hypothetical protein